MSIHGFCGASQIALGACVFIRSTLPNRLFEFHLLISKSRITPLRATTILRLELCGALLLAELISEIKTELSLLNITTPADIYF